MQSGSAIAISVNGEPLQVPAGSNITGILGFLNIPPDRVAVELDKTLVRKRDWAATEVGAGAQIEVVEFVGGG